MWTGRRDRDAGMGRIPQVLEWRQIFPAGAQLRVVALKEDTRKGERVGKEPELPALPIPAEDLGKDKQRDAHSGPANRAGEDLRFRSIHTPDDLQKPFEGRFPNPFSPVRGATDDLRQEAAQLGECVFYLREHHPREAEGADGLERGLRCDYPPDAIQRFARGVRDRDKAGKGRGGSCRAPTQDLRI